MADAPKINPKETLRESYPKLNQAIDNANEAIKKATTSDVNAAKALTTANSVQEQFNQVVIEGDSSVEAAQARVSYTGTTYTTLKERLDQEHESVTTQLAENTKRLKELHANVKEFGAKGDGVTDDTSAIQSALDSLGSTGGTVYFPDGTYLVKGTILVQNKIRIVGYGRKRVIITNTDGITVYNVAEPIVASSNYKNASANEDIYISSIQFKSAGERTAYTVELTNTISAHVNDCDFNEHGNSSPQSLHGLGIIRKNDYTDHFYLAKVKHCRFSRSVLNLQATDSYLISNEFWGNEREYAVQLHNASNSFVTQNQIVGGMVYGGLYLTANANDLKIVQNYFDGSHANIDTCWGIYSNSNSCINNIIANNNFWRQKGGGVKFANLSNTRITDNVFVECDYYGKGEPDIEIGIGSNPAWDVGGNYISNTHFRHKMLNETRDGVIDRDTVNPTPIMIIHNTLHPTIVEDTMLAYHQYYGSAIFSGSVIPKGGNYPNKVTPTGYENTYRRTTGTATIPTGQTSVWVTHNLGYIPKSIQLTLESPLQNSKAIYISNKTESGFTIKADMGGTTDVLTGDIIVSYEIVKEM